MFLPGWDSAKRVDSIHSALEVIGLLSFAVAIILEAFDLRLGSIIGFSILVVAETFRYVYGRREKRLSEDAIEQEREVSRDNERRIADLNERAERDRLERVRMERRLVRRTISRNLSDDEVKALQRRLRVFAGQPFAITFAPTDDAATMEPEFFASQLCEVLQGAGWAQENIPMTQRVGKGVLIECNRGDERSAFRLARALSEVGIEVKASSVEHKELPQLRIHVGLL